MAINTDHCARCGRDLEPGEGEEIGVAPDGTGEYLCESCYAKWRDEQEEEEEVPPL